MSASTVMGLDHLWAGWRSSYIEEVSADSSALRPDSDGSLFERILNSGEPDHATFIVYRGPRCFAILNAYPYTSGHVLVMPNRAVPELEDLDDDEHAELWSTVRDAVVAIKAAYRCDGVNLGMNLGRAGGAGVPDHLHVHVLPRWDGDTNFMTTVAETRVLPEPLSLTWSKLRRAWPS
ncbi:MAG: HIT domain-containing protein [Acidimicrobiales bacterium]|nr:HIT domain-containing protein [Acidimicrobiales bacterium]